MNLTLSCEALGLAMLVLVEERNSERNVPETGVAIGEPVRLVYLPNTRYRALDRRYRLILQCNRANVPVDKLQAAEGIHDRQRRSMLIGRIRTFSSDAVIDLAQRLCIAFDEPFVGIDGCYVRIYGDDTA